MSTARGLDSAPRSGPLSSRPCLVTPRPPQPTHPFHLPIPYTCPSPTPAHPLHVQIPYTCPSPIPAHPLHLPIPHTCPGLSGQCPPGGTLQ